MIVFWHTSLEYEDKDEKIKFVGTFAGWK